MADTSSSTSKKSTAKKSTAKKSTAKKSTAKKSTAKKSAAKKSAAKKSTAGGSTAEQRPEAVYAMATLDAAGELSGNIDSAAQEFAAQLNEIGEQANFAVPEEIITALADAARSNDIAEFLRAQQAYADAVQSTLQGAVEAYNDAATAYLQRLQDSVTAARDRSNQLVADYATAVADHVREHPNDPAAAAQAGWSLLAAAQLATPQPG